MTRLILRALNAPGLILITIFGIALQTSLFQSWPFYYLQPDIVLLIVIWCGLRRGFGEGGTITLILSEISELHSAAPQGLYMIAYMAVYLIVRGISRLFVIPNLASFIIVTLFASLFWKLSNLGILYMLGSSGNQWKHTLTLLFPGAVIEGALGIWIYRWLEKFDELTFKHGQTEREIEDQLQLDYERI